MIISGHPIAAGEIDPCFPAYSMLVDDLQRLFEYVHPCDANLTTFSHRAFELLLRACTEFESTCKNALVADGVSLPDRPKISDFAPLAPELRDIRVGALFWSPQKRYFQPFQNWDPPRTVLRWYQAYNSVKHNRSSLFEKASLENLLLAVSALCALHFRRRGHTFFNPFGFSSQGMRALPDGATEHIIDNSIFSIVLPKGA
jgi:hypothetical protein